MNNYAVSSAQLGEILKKSSSTLAVSGDSMEQVVAMGAAMQGIIQDASVVGSTLKVVDLRLRGSKAELEEAGEETDNMANSVSKLRGQIMALTKVNGNPGVDIMKNANEYKTMFDILDSIKQVWEDLTDIDRAALLELMAGKNRAQGLAALLNNWDEAKAALEDAYNAEGSALRENERYMESISGRTAVLQNELQRLAQTSINTDFLKGFIDLGTKAVKVITKLADGLGGINMIISTILGTMMGFSGHGRHKSGYAKTQNAS